MPTLETGNAHAAGAASRGWFVGDLAGWAAERGAALATAETPRQSGRVEVKWLAHPPGDARSGWAEPDGSYTLSLLIDGEMRLDFRSPDGGRESVRLAARGDYVVWYGPAYSHAWRTDAGCTMVTVRWPAADGGAPG